MERNVNQHHCTFNPADLANSDRDFFWHLLEFSRILFDQAHGAGFKTSFSLHQITIWQLRDYCSLNWWGRVFLFFSFSLPTLSQNRVYVIFSVFTPPRNRGGVIFSLQFVCLSVCPCVRLFSCEQNSSRKNAPIWMRFSLNKSYCLIERFIAVILIPNMSIL